ncbi:hypothetical protein C8R44DRAFT_620952 [Mycena epipterygia]|nr:hypothetical protein C8R44DRAFT_620952 [Mycena epipterygia]
MPARGDRNAPIFDASKPHELRRYFSDLEFLFGRSAITDVTEMKKHSTRFLTVEDQETWEMLPSFSDAQKSYDAFKADVLKLYAGNDEDRRYGLSDLDALIGQYSRVGIITKDDLTSFYRQFLRITTYLLSKSRLSASEQSRAFLRAMQPATLLASIKQRLQIKQPDIHPEDPYELADLYEAAQFVIAGSRGTFVNTGPLSPSSTSAPTVTEVKPDPGIAALVGTVTKLIEVLATQQTTNDSGFTNGSNSKKTRPDGCGYCSDLEHFINQCQHVLVDIKAGKCRRNSDGRVVLPSGAFVPRTITGKDLRTRIEEWHRQNPGQLASAQLMAKKALQANNNDPDRALPPSSMQPATFAPPAPASASVVPASVPVLPPQHRFASARDAAYAPTKDRNFGLAPQKPAYRTTAPIYNEKDAKEVFNAALDSPVTITNRQLLSIAPEVRAQMREETSSRRAPTKENKPAVQQLFHDVDIHSPLPFSIDSALESDTIEEQPGAFVIPDPYAVYYDAGPIPDDLVVSMESSSIRSIVPIIDNQQQVECIIDGGSQIIAMSESVCHELALSYDPRIVLRMQSANKSVSPSLGLARNVPFRIGDITLYLQVHIVRNPAYDVLLGRPFDVLTQSIIRNFTNEDQTITICDPNTGKLATVPTVPRGSPRSRPQGFPNSRN